MRVPVALSRRSILRSAAALITSQLPLRANAASVGFPSVVDVSYDSTHLASALKQRGVRAVFRYYALDVQPELPTKILRGPELDALLTNGFAIGVVYQYYNNVLTNLNEERARLDAKHSIDYATNAIHQPKGTAIYFGVDGDWPASEQINQILSYFRVVNDIFDKAGNPFDVGVYGSGQVCMELKRRKLAQYFWLAKSTGFTNTREFYNLGQWHLYQNMLDVSVDSEQIDTSICNRTNLNIGVFDRAGPMTKLPQRVEIFENRRFVASDGLALRENPNPTAPIQLTLKKRDNVILLRSAGQWAFVATRERGVGEGYCEARWLSSLAIMP